MIPLTSEELAALFRSVSAHAVAGFVADLYAVRGWTIAEWDDSETVFTATRDGESRRVAVVVTDTIPAGVDTLVDAGANRDAVEAETIDVLDIDDVRNVLLYAVDRDTANELLERWFDRPVDSTAESTGKTDEPSGVTGRSSTPIPSLKAASSRPNRTAGTESTKKNGSTGRWRPPDRRTVVAVIAVVALLGLSGVLLALTTGDELRPGGSAEIDTTDSSMSLAPATTTPVTLTPQTPSPTPQTDDQSPPGLEPDTTLEAVLPPGVNQTGITDYRTMVDTHRTMLESESYRVTLLYREFASGTVTGVSRQTVRVEDETTYHGTTTRVGTFVTEPPRLVDGPVYANGTTAFELTDTGVTQRPTISEDVFLRRHSRYLGYYLSVDESHVSGFETDRPRSVVQISTDGDPWPGVENATGNVVVTGSGIVVQVWRTYEIPHSDVEVIVTIQVSDVGQTRVAEPVWVEDE